MAKELVLINNVWVIRTVTPTTSERTVTYSYGSTVTQVFQYPKKEPELNGAAPFQVVNVEAFLATLV